MNSAGLDALPQAYFMSTEYGERFCLYHAPHGVGCKGRVLYLHPFAEEMNASRRVVAQQCRALAATGFAVLQIDLFGCGDSSGEFSDATWQHWLHDVDSALAWLMDSTHAGTPLWIWGLRAGALLACESLRKNAGASSDITINLLFWQPVASGAQQLQQFLRLHNAAQWLKRSKADEPPNLALAKGHHAHVAGYSLSPLLAHGLEAARLDLPPGRGRVEIIDMQASDEPKVSPWVTRLQTQWESCGWQVDAHAVNASHFWQNVVESSLPDSLNRATLQAIA